jgi:transketolase
MGPTHHAIEDYGILLGLPNMSAYIPVFDEDLYALIPKIGTDKHPAYLRLGRGETPKDFIIPEYSPWRQLTSGQGKVVLAVGPIAGAYIAAFNDLPESVRPNLWAVAQLPLSKNPLPKILQEQMKGGSGLVVIEEHISRGGFGSELALHMLENQISSAGFSHFYALSHTYSHYGSQQYLRKQSGLGVDSICAAIMKM